MANAIPAERKLGLAYVTLALAVAPLVTNGLARFAYALLLPAMRADLGWSYGAAGAINAANAAGYLAGAIVAAWVAARVGARRAFVWGLLLTALSLLGSGAASSLLWQVMWRGLAGVTGAVAFVVGAALAGAAASRAPRARQGLVIATYFGGAGVGVLVSAAVVPPLLAVGAGGWRLGWIALAAASLAALAGALPTVPDDAARPVAAAVPEVRPRRPSLAPATTAYFLFGAGYIGYMTFIIALLRAAAVPGAMITAFWIVLGLALVASCYGWGALFARFAAGSAMAVSLLIDAAGALLPIVSSAAWAIFGSAVLFGAAVMAAPGAATEVVRRALPASDWTAALGRITVVFGIGQCLGPIAAGALADSAFGIATGLALSAALLVAGAAAAAFQR